MLLFANGMELVLACCISFAFPFFDRSPITLSICVEKKVISAGDGICVTAALTNSSRRSLLLALGIVSDSSVWLRPRVALPQGNQILRTGFEKRFISTRSLPALQIVALQPGDSISIRIRYEVDALGLNLNTDTKLFQFALVYRFRPEEESDGAGYYQKLAKENKIWTGTVCSNAVEFEIKE